MNEDEEKYCLTPWGCLMLTLNDYGINTEGIRGVVGKHIVEDFMELMEKSGYVRRDSDE